MSLIPETWRLSELARELGMHAHTLVEASRAGRFPPLIRVGRRWFADAEKVREWFRRQHATTTMTPARVEVLLQAAREAAGPRRAKRGRR